MNPVDSRTDLVGKLLTEIIGVLTKGKPSQRLDKFHEKLRFKIENAIIEAEWQHELELICIEAERDAQLVQRARGGDKEAEFQVKLRRGLHREAIKRLTI